MNETSDRDRSLVSKLSRAGAAVVAGTVAMTAALGVVSAIGFGFQGFSASWQLLFVIGALSVWCASLVWPSFVAEQSRAGQQTSNAPQGMGILRFVAYATVMLVLLLLFLGVGRLPAPTEESRHVAVVRSEPSLAPPAAPPAPPLLMMRGHSAAMAALALGEGYSRSEDAEKRIGGDVAVYEFRESEPGHSLRWLRVGSTRWPISQPPQILLVTRDANVDPAALVGKIGPIRLADEPAFALATLLLPTTPKKPDAFPHPIEQFDDPGFKPLWWGGAGLSATKLKLFQWSALPARSTPTAPRPAGDSEIYSLLVESRVEHKPTDTAPAGIRRQIDVLSVVYKNGLPEYFLSAPSNVGVDTLGDAGLQQGLALLDGAARIWRSRRYSAPGAWLVPEQPSNRRPTSLGDLARDRFLPAPQAEAPRDFSGGQEFPSNVGLVVIAVFLIGLSAWRR